MGPEPRASPADRQPDQDDDRAGRGHPQLAARPGADHPRGGGLLRLGRGPAAAGQAGAAGGAALRPAAALGQRRGDRPGRARSRHPAPLRRADERARPGRCSSAAPTSPASSGIVDRDNYSCTTDLAVLAHAVLQQPLLAPIVASRSAIIPFPIKGRKLYLYNNNPLLLLGLSGTDGVKTGYTVAPAPCLVATVRRGNAWLGVVLLDSVNPAAQAQKLFNAGFAEAPPRLTREDVDMRSPACQHPTRTIRAGSTTHRPRASITPYTGRRRCLPLPTRPSSSARASTSRPRTGPASWSSPRCSRESRSATTRGAPVR